MRVFHSVEDDDQGIFAPLAFNDVIQIAVLLGRGDGDHALVAVIAGQAV